MFIILTVFFYSWQIGNEPVSKRTNYINADERTLNIVENFDERTPLDNLRGLSYNYELH